MRSRFPPQSSGSGTREPVVGNTGRINILQKAVHRVFLGRKVCIEKRMIQKHLQASAVTVKLQKVPHTRFLHHALRRDRAGSSAGIPLI